MGGYGEPYHATEVLSASGASYHFFLDPDGTVEAAISRRCHFYSLATRVRPAELAPLDRIPRNCHDCVAGREVLLNQLTLIPCQIIYLCLEVSATESAANSVGRSLEICREVKPSDTSTTEIKKRVSWHCSR